MWLFQAFTNNSKHLRTDFVPKNSKKRTLKGGWDNIEEEQGDKTEGWVLDIGGHPTPFSCFS